MKLLVSITFHSKSQACKICLQFDQLIYDHVLHTCNNVFCWQIEIQNWMHMLIFKV